MVGLLYISIPPLRTDGITHITVLSLGPNEALHLPHKMRVLIVLDPALPIAPSSGDQHLLGVSCHRPVQILLALDVQSRWRLAALTRRRRAFFY